MIPRHRQRDFKIVLAAYARHLSEQNDDTTIVDALFDIQNKARATGLDFTTIGPDGLWVSDDAFYVWTHRNREPILQMLDEIADSSEEYAISFFSRYIYGGEIKEGGSEQDKYTDPDATEYEHDAAAKRRDDIRFVEMCLEAFAAEHGAKPIPAKIQSYAVTIVAGKQ